MRKPFLLFVLFWVGLSLGVALQISMAQVIPPKAQGTSQGGPTIDQVQAQDAMGPKARVAVNRLLSRKPSG